MVKRRNKNTKKKANGKEFKENGTEAGKINASTVYETCTEQLSSFGGLLPLIKFLDIESPVSAKHEGPFYGVFQLTNISRPVVIHESLQNRTALGSLKAAAFISISAAKRAFVMSKQLASQQVFGFIIFG